MNEKKPCETRKEGLGPHRLLHAVAGDRHRRHGRSTRGSTASGGGSRRSSSSSMRCVGISVTAGYHRLFAHRSYECHPAGPGLLPLLRRHGAAELDPRLGLGPSHPPPVRRPRLGSVQHPARRLVGAHPLDLLQEPGRTGPSTTCRTCRRTRSCGSSTATRRGSASSAASGFRRSIGWAMGSAARRPAVGRLPARRRDSPHDVLRQLDRAPLRLAAVHRGELGARQRRGSRC